MPAPDERTALNHPRIPDWMREVPQDLYPKSIASRRYLGTAGSCKQEGPGFFYYPNDWTESECVISLGLEIRRSAPRRPKRLPKMEGPAVPTALYRLSDAAGELLYMGISDDPLRRWGEHAGDRQWWPSVANLSLEWFGSRPAALKAEALAIRAEEPKYNVLHNAQNVA
jgi:hypothetical protein